MMPDNIENSSDTSMEHVLLISSKSKIKEKLRTCCSNRPQYRIRRLCNKGAILILFWNFLVVSVFYHLSVDTNNLSWQSMVWSVTLPIAGCLADVYLGRYKVIRWSMLIMWVAAMLITVSTVVAQVVASYYHINTAYIMKVLVVMLSLGFGGFQANVILFGIDQLHDASTDEITSFISWYVWTYICGGVVIYFAYTCMDEKYWIFEQLLVCICLSVALISLFYFDRILIKEPIVKQNPFLSIYKVIKYAIKTKHPQCRSAFTFCEDDLPSRIDFGKSKYGGPFSTEQVEDVKTFMRLLLVLVVGAAIPCGIWAVNIIRVVFLKKLIYIDDLMYTTQWLRKCIWKTFSTHLLYHSGTVLIPLYEFVLYPLLHKRLYWVNSYWKMSLSAVPQMVRIFILMTFLLKSRHTYIVHNGYNATIQCIFEEHSGTLSSIATFNIMWMTLPDLLNYISIVMFAIGGIELMCSQSPYSLRGLIFGAGYCCVMFYNVIGYFTLNPFRKKPSHTNWGTGIVSCGFWYLLFILLLIVLDSVMFCTVIKWYRKRKREDVLPNEQIFAERYYDR